MIKWIDDRSVMVHGKVTYGTGKGMCDIIPEGLLQPKRIDQLIESGKITIQYDRPAERPVERPVTKRDKKKARAKPQGR
jgi:hypothetical protein